MGDMHMKNKIRYTLALISIGLCGVVQAETYSYSGVNYHSATAPYTTDMAVSGSFTTSSDIPPDSDNYDLRPIITSWSFYDGVNTLTDADSELWDIGGGFPPVASTDSEGNITAIILLFHSPPVPHAIDDVIDRLQIRSDANYAHVLNDTICTNVTDDFCDGYTWSTEPQTAQADLGSWSKGESAPPNVATTAIPTMPAYGLVITALGLLLAAFRVKKPLRK